METHFANFISACDCGVNLIETSYFMSAVSSQGPRVSQDLGERRVDSFAKVRRRGRQKMMGRYRRKNIR